MDSVVESSGKIGPSQIRMARAGLGLTVRELAELANVNKATVVRIEAGYSTRASSLEAVTEVLIAHGAKFVICPDTETVLVSVPN